MKVNVLRKNETTFSEIEFGEIFEFEGDFYMKIDNRTNKIEYNAISVYIGCIYRFEDFEEVVKTKSTLNIEI